MSTYISHMLKMEMERVWRIKSCLSPCHLIRWNREGFGFRFSNWLFWTKGRFVTLKRRKRLF